MKLIALLFLGWIWVGSSQAQNLQWKELNTPVKASLRGLSPVSDKICWASGSGGTWLKTTDGGESWEYGVIAGLDSVDFRSIHAFDQNTAVAASAGQPAVIYRTTDGGKSWLKVHQEGPEAFFDGISFSGNKKGYILGDPVNGKWMILESKNGGKTWKSLENLPDAEAGEAAFAASSSSLIALKKELIFGTGGSVSKLHFGNLGEEHSWSKTKTPILQGEPSQGIFAIAMTEQGILSVGGDYQKLESRDRNAVLYQGDSWKIPLYLPLGYRSGVAYIPAQKITIAVGPSGSDISYDFGMNWANFSSTGYHGVKISEDKKTIWASGSDGRIGILTLW